MFKINPAPTFEFDAQITVPGQEQAASVRFTARHKGRDELAAWIEGAAGRTDRDFLGAVLQGWAGVLGDDGEAVPFSADNLGRMLNAYPACGRELYEQYVAALTESRRKNS